jgi:hypothetical protein
MRPLIGAGFLATLLYLPGCGGANRSVTAPSPTATAPSPPPGAPTATLKVSTFTAVLVSRSPTMNFFEYAVQLRLSETGGRSGAWLTRLVITVLPGGDRDFGCGAPAVRIGPGGTWDMASLGYCALDPTSSYEASGLVVSVGFTDDDGRVGSLEATAIVSKP